MKINLDSLRITVSEAGNKNIQSALEKACMIVETDAKNNCPKDNGILANSIKWEVEDNVGYIYSDEPYAIYTELGTGLYASDNDGSLNGVGRQTPWHYFYTGKKLSSAEREYIAKYGYQTFQGKQGIWRTTRGQTGKHFLYNALNDNKQRIIDCFKGE